MSEQKNKFRETAVSENTTLLKVGASPRNRKGDRLAAAFRRATRWLWALRPLRAPSRDRAGPLALDVKSTLAKISALGGQVPAVSLRSGDDEPFGASDRRDKYHLLDRLGVGGMGEVYLVYDRDLRRRSALKTVRESRWDLEARFLREAQVVGQLAHPNIVPVYDLGLSGSGQPFYTMPVVRGQSLEGILSGLARGEPELLKTYSLTRLMQVFLQLTLAVAYAHDKGVVHRDIKPANVMLGEHGEVLLLDWGLAKVLGDSEIEVAFVGEDKLKTDLVGTPSYMAPEQISGRPVDARTDVYALGVVLYELLTWTSAFEGDTQTILAAHQTEQPGRPRMRAPDREIPLELEDVCLKAIRKNPEDRHQSARELHDEVQAWLEAAADKAKRRERAEQLSVRGQSLLDSYRRVKEDMRGMEDNIRELRRTFKGWQPVEEKAELYRAEDRLEAARRSLVETASSLVMTLSAAIGQDEQHPRARRLMADFYWERFLESEARGDMDSRYFEKLVAAFHDGKYDLELKGDGVLRLGSIPEGAEVWLYENVEENLVLVPRRGRLLGRTPVGPIPLPMGSYLAILKKEGYPDVRYPVWISRNRRWSGNVRLYADAEIGSGFCCIPAGPFLQGGDEEVKGWSLPRSEIELSDFFIARHPVTFAEYLEFLNDLAQSDPEEALRRSPRRSPDGGSFLRVDREGRLELPGEQAEAHHWSHSTPVVHVSWYDAVAYCRWRSSREGTEVTLPTESEWEKASRGVDGRWFPWGCRFDPRLCNMRQSRLEGAAPLTVDECSTDVSIYGVYGTAGNVRDWTATVVADEEGEGSDTRVIRGGAWNLPAIICRCANRFWLTPHFLSSYVGFRVARSTPLPGRAD